MGNEAMQHFFHIHGPVKGVLNMQQNPDLCRIRDTSGCHPDPEAAAGYSKLSHKHKSPKTAPRTPNQERRVTAKGT